MKFKINHTVEREVEIEIPSYFNVSCHWFKAYSETQVLAVCDLGGYESVQKQHICIIFNAGGDPVLVTEDQFNDKLKAISDKLLSL